MQQCPHSCVSCQIMCDLLHEALIHDVCPLQIQQSQAPDWTKLPQLNSERVRKHLLHAWNQPHKCFIFPRVHAVVLICRSDFFCMR
jgi:hypothetical protein